MSESTNIPLAQSSQGRVSGKSWKPVPQTATTRAQMSKGRRSAFHDRREKEEKEKAIKLLQAELKFEKEQEIARRRQITKERKAAAEERRRLEEEKAKLGARRAARLRRKQGRTKKINQ